MDNIDKAIQEKRYARRLANLNTAFATLTKPSERQMLSRRITKILNEVWEGL